MSKGGSRLANMFGMKGAGTNINEEKLVRDDESMSQSSDKRDPDAAAVEKEKAVEEQGPNSKDLYIANKHFTLHMMYP